MQLNSVDLPIRGSKLTLDHLKKHPLWGSFEGDDSELFRPVDSLAPFKVDCDPLLIYATFMTPDGRPLSGCVAVDRADDRVYLVEIHVEEAVYGFNISLADIAEQQLKLLQGRLGVSNERIFPLTFSTPVYGPDNKLFSGEFSIDFA